MNNNNQYERYQRQMLLREFGIAAQAKLLQSKVLVIGAGGLGCPVLQYLAAAGVGTIGIADDDVVSLSNLHRQVLYSIEDIGQCKSTVAAEKLKLMNDDVAIITYNLRLINKNAIDIIDQYDIVVDGTDNFSSRYMINDACVLLNKPLIYGAVSRFEGQVAVFNFKQNNNTVNYRDLFPVLPKDDEVLNCSEAGVIGVLPGIIGTMMANETIKLITGVGINLAGKLLTYNTFNNSFYTINLTSNEKAQQLIPQDEESFLKMDYNWFCSSLNNYEINYSEFDSLIDDYNTVIIDVREKEELPLVNEFKHINIPLPELKSNHQLITKDKVVVFCKTGARSLQAAKSLTDLLNNKKIYSLKGGILEWKSKHHHS